MSVRLMSKVFDADLRDVKLADGQTVSASALNSILLAMADHANDEGYGAYPSLSKLMRKSKLSRPTVVKAMKAAKLINIIKFTGVSHRGTNSYRVIEETLDSMQFASKATLPPSKATLPAGGKATLPESSFDSSKKIVTKEFVSEKLVELCGGAVNSYTAQYLTEWFEIHEPKRVLQAIQEAEARGAKSPQYVDKVLQSWEKKGEYPPTIEERKAAAESSRKNGNGGRRGNGRLGPPVQDDFMEKLAERKARLEAEAV